MTLNDVYYADGRYVAVGIDFRASVRGEALFATSTDGHNWKYSPNSTSNAQLSAVHYAAGKWVACGSSGTFFYSTDGVTWNRGTAANTLSAWFGSVAYGDGNFVAVTQLFVSGKNQLTLFRSTDGQNWTREDTGVPISGIGPVRYANGTWVVVANSQSPFGTKILTSTDLVQWNTDIPVLTGGTTFEGLAYGNARWVAVATTAGWSTDGVTWSSVTVNPSTPPSQAVALHDMIFANDEFWGVGDRGVIRKSPDGISWTTISNGPIANLNGIATNGTQLVAVGAEGVILTSMDAQNWTQRASGISNPTFRDIIYAAGTYLATGSHTATSTDGVTWTEVPAVGFPRSARPNAAAYGAGTWVLVGAENNYSWSTNGRDWTLATVKPPGIKPLNDVAYGNGIFVAAGGDFMNGILVSSANGREWEDRTPAGSGQFYKVAYGNGVFVVAGAPKSGSNSPQVLVSTDGVTWTQASGNPNFGNASSLFFDGARFVILDRDYTRESSDGINWRSLIRPLPISNAPTAGVLHHDSYVVTGSDGLIIVAPRNPLAFADSVTGDWGYAQWFGYYHFGLIPWLYHFTLGWVYVSSAGDTLYFFRPGQGWLYSSRTLFPYAFAFESAKWLWFDLETGLSYEL